MQPMPRIVVFWVLFALLMLAGWMIGHAAQITQGAGAMALVKSAKSSRAAADTAAALALPTVVVTNNTRTYHFAATATDKSDLSSDYSTEAVLTVTNRIQTVTCAWNPSAGTNAIDHYTLYQGSAKGNYTNSITTTNTQATIRVNPPVPTNLVLTVTSVGLTNIQWRDGPKGNWALLGVTNFATNAASTKLRLYRGLGRPATAVKQLFVRYRLQ